MELEAELTRSEPDATVVQVKLEMISRYYERVEALDIDILSVVNRHGSEEEQDSEITAVSEYEEKFRTAKVRGDNFLDVKAVSSRSASSTNGGSTHGSEPGSRKRYKLPKIEIRKFNGDLKEWLGFWSQFEKIHEVH